MKRFLLLALLMSALFSACHKEEMSSTTVNEIEEINARITPPVPPGLPPPIVEHDINNLTLCKGRIMSQVNPITVSSAWTVGHSTSPAYIDYLLDEAFRCSPTFSSCTIRPAYPPTLVYADFLLRDDGRMEFDPLLGDIIVYDYLSNNISTAIAEDITRHFACEIRNYRDTYLPAGSHISNVDFSGDALLCTCPSGLSRYLRASVTFWVF